MASSRRAPSLQREIVLWYSLVLLVALGVVTGLTFLLLRGALERTVRTSLQQSARTVEELYLPPGVPRVETRDSVYRMRAEGLEVLRRQTVLVTGDTLRTWVARSDDAEEHALRSFLLISLLLIPVAGVAAAMGGRVLIERLLHPLDRLVGATREISIAGLSRRVAEPDRPEELQELARAFNEMLTRLDRAVQALSRFTADASHELRTPLTSIRGTIQVALTRDRSAAELQETLAEVLEETEWMLHLVDGLLMLARGEEGSAPARLEPVDVSALLADVGEVGEALVAGRPVDVRMQVPARLVVHGSPSQLRQVFLNLVSNAVKFTERGTVTIGAREVTNAGAPGAEGRWLEVWVEDTGVGIAPEELPRVFDRFYRGDAARGRPGGTGLGLAIARLLVQQHGGEMSVRSEVGRGSRFRVLLPIPEPELTPDAAGA